MKMNIINITKYVSRFVNIFVLPLLVNIQHRRHTNLCNILVCKCIIRLYSAPMSVSNYRRSNRSRGFSCDYKCIFFTPVSALFFSSLLFSLHTALTFREPKKCFCLLKLYSAYGYDTAASTWKKKTPISSTFFPILFDELPFHLHKPKHMPTIYSK